MPHAPLASALGRRSFLQYAGSGIAASLAATPATAAALETGRIEFSPIAAPGEAPEKAKPLPLPEREKVGYALVGLGRLVMNQVLPAFGETRWSKPTALVSGDRAKALEVARQYGIPERSVYSYADYDRLADDAAVRVVYIALPNSMHAEYTVRAARAGKHVLCEKPMANSVAECRQMIDACKAADRKLMIAYRSQYEPMDRLIAKMAREKRFGSLREFSAFNSQNQGDPGQWRLKRALAGGGSLPDVGIYCLNAARFLSGEEPSQVIGHTHAPPNDPRFREVEDTAQFILQFPSGFVATCSSGYSSHRAQALRLMGSEGWAELDPAFAYTGLKLRLGSVVDGRNVVSEPAIESGDQFAHEFDHMSRCVLENREPHTGGAEGLADMRIVEAIYTSAREGRAVSLAPPPAPTRGPEPHADDIGG